MTDRRVTLTFDNGPCSEATPAVLDELAARELTAWFCVVGSRLRTPGSAALVRRMLDEGHRLANHSLTHETPLGDQPTPQHAHRQVVEMDRLMTDMVGAWGERWFRPFGGQGRLGRHVFSDAAVDDLERLGYSVLLWNCVPRDWDDPDGWVDTALRQIAQLEHAVVVLHDTVPAAVAHLPRFLDELASRDVTITVDVPDSCVPMRAGVAGEELAALTTPTP